MHILRYLFSVFFKLYIHIYMHMHIYSDKTRRILQLVFHQIAEENNYWGRDSSETIKKNAFNKLCLCSQSV